MTTDRHYRWAAQKVHHIKTTAQPRDPVPVAMRCIFLAYFEQFGKAFNRKSFLNSCETGEPYVRLRRKRGDRR